MRDQDKTDIDIQMELDEISDMIRNKIYYDYCEYEDEVAMLIKKYCPICSREIKNTKIGIFILMGNIRNYIRQKAGIKFNNIE